MRRIFNLLERWLPLLACLSGGIVPVSEVVRDGDPSDGDRVPDLDEQMREIYDFVVLQERRWGLQRRIKGPFVH